MITPEDEVLFRRRYRGPQCEGNLTYAKQQATAYAELHAGCMPEWVRIGVAALHFRHVSMMDAGEKKLLRIGIDCLLAVGRACSND